MDDYDHDYKQFIKGDYNYTKLEKDDYNYDYSAITVSRLRLSHIMITIMIYKPI